LSGGTEILWRRPAPMPLCPPQIPHYLTRARTRATVVGKRGNNRLSYGTAIPLLKYRVMEACHGGIVPSFLTSAQNEAEWSASPGGGAESVWTLWRREENLLSLSGFETWPFSPYSCRYTGSPLSSAGVKNSGVTPILPHTSSWRGAWLSPGMNLRFRIE
jgi:hypothetical protein